VVAISTGTLDLWSIVVSIGIFLLGMHLLEQGLQGIGSKTLKQFLQAQTNSPLKGVFTGTLVTAFLQSSSLVGLIVLAFVGAGMLEMRNALGVILGSNLGTTVTGWMLAVLGFKLDLARFYQPLVAIGAFLTVFLPAGRRPYYLGNLVLGLGLLLMGLGTLITSLENLVPQVDTAILRGQGLLVYCLIGALLTALVQSSSVVMMVVLSALHAGVISVTEAIPIAIGSNIGTTSTVLLGAVDGLVEKRRVAYAHLIFNLLTAIVALLCLPLFVFIIHNVFGASDPLFVLVLFHSLFNFLGILIFLPFLDPFIGLLNWMAPERSLTPGATAYIHKVSSSVPDGAIEAVRKELTRMLFNAIRLNMHSFHIHAHAVFDENSELLAGEPLRYVARYEQEYKLLKQTESEVLGYTYAIQRDAKEEEDLRLVTQLNHAVRNATYAAKFIKDIRHNVDEFRVSPSGTIHDLYASFCLYVTGNYHGLATLMAVPSSSNIANEYVELYRQVRRGYEWYLNEIYTVVGADKHLNHEIANLLNINRAAYLSTTALFEAVRVLLNLEEDILAGVQTIPQPRKILKQESQ
jgi:phosphate:Na+ symporter